MPRVNSERAQALWRGIVDALRGELSSLVIDTYIEYAKGVDVTDSAFVLCCENTVAKEWIERNRREYIEKRLSAELNAPITLVCLASDEEAREYVAEREKPDGSSFSSEFTFENFVVGGSNRFAAAAAQAVAQGSTSSYNPLFIYGGSGLGKTHLLYAIANAYRADDSGRNVIYVRCEDFTNEFIETVRVGHLRSGREKEFRDKYRSPDLFLVDDIQFIAGKEQTQEEFFNPFNTLYEAGKQIVLTSDRPPKDRARLDERLRTRFESGLICDVQPPELETRVAIVKNKAASLGLALSDQVVSYIAENVTANVRQIEGVVKKLQAFAALLREPVTVTTAQQAIGDVFTEKMPPTADVIIDECERFYDLEPGSLASKRRDGKTARARQVAGYLMRVMPRMSFPEIGRALGRDHSTMIYAVEQIDGKRKNDPQLDTDIKDLMLNITNRQ